MRWLLVSVALLTALLLQPAVASAAAADLDLRSSPAASTYSIYFVARGVGLTSPGHAFVAWETSDSAFDLKTAEVMGFYPSAAGLAALTGAPGKLTASNVDWHSSVVELLRVELDLEAWVRTRAVREGWRTRVDAAEIPYAALQGVPGISGANCITFAKELAVAAGLRAPPSEPLLPGPFVRALVAANR